MSETSTATSQETSEKLAPETSETVQETPSVLKNMSYDDDGNAVFEFEDSGKTESTSVETPEETSASKPPPIPWEKRFKGLQREVTPKLQRLADLERENSSLLERVQKLEETTGKNKKLESDAASIKAIQEKFGVDVEQAIALKKFVQEEVTEAVGSLKKDTTELNQKLSVQQMANYVNSRYDGVNGPPKEAMAPFMMELQKLAPSDADKVGLDKLLDAAEHVGYFSHAVQSGQFKVSGPLTISTILDVGREVRNLFESEDPDIHAKMFKQVMNGSSQETSSDSSSSESSSQKETTPESGRMLSSVSNVELPNNSKPLSAKEAATQAFLQFRS